MLRPRIAVGRGRALVLAALLLIPRRAGADDTIGFRADRVDADPKHGEVALSGHVELRSGRARVTAEHLRVRFDHGAIVFDGDARLALCPCLDPPLVFAARGGRLDPSGDVHLTLPRVEIAGAPIFGLPFLWLRPPDRAGLLPPLVELRGGDGVLLGSGVYLPWRGEGGRISWVELIAGGYLVGGAELGAKLRTPETEAGVVADLVHGTRVALDGRGSYVFDDARAAAAWTADAIRGDRARSGTVDLAPAAQPWDTAAVEASLRREAGPVSALFAGGAFARAMRGEGPIAAGPRAALAIGGPIGTLGSWSADAGAFMLGGALDAGGSLPYARAAAGAEIDARPGPFELRASARARARFADDGAPSPSSEAAAAAQIDLALPFLRSFDAEGGAPLVHWITPSLTLRGALADQRGAFFLPIGGVVPTSSWIAAAGLGTALGHPAGSALRLDVRAGATGGAGDAEALLHARLVADARLAAAAVEAAAVGDHVGRGQSDPGSARSFAFLARARLGPESGAFFRFEAAAQEGATAGQARAVAAGTWASLPGDALAYLASPGWTGAGELSFPWTRAFRTTARADVDFQAHTLLAVRGLAEYRHPCGCLALGLSGAHRTGREGVDVAVTLDVAPARAGGRTPPSER